MNDFKIDLFSPQNFKVQFERIPTMAYFTKQFQIPGLQGGQATQPTRFNNVPLPGDAIQYDYMSLQFNLDEDWKNYLEIHKWLTQINFPQQHAQYQSLEDEELPPMSDASVMLMNNANRPIKEMKFKDCFPINLSGFTLDTQVTNAMPVTISATFAYSFFEVV